MLHCSLVGLNFLSQPVETILLRLFGDPPPPSLRTRHAIITNDSPDRSTRSMALQAADRNSSGADSTQLESRLNPMSVGASKWPEFRPLDGPGNP